MSEKMVTIPQVMCDFNHTEDTPGERLFIQDAAGVKYILDGCEYHRRRLPLTVAVPLNERPAPRVSVERDGASEGDWIDVQVASRMLGRSTPWTYKLGTSGKLETTLNNGRRVFRRSSVEAFARGEAPGAPGLSPQAVQSTMQDGQLIDTSAAARILGVHPTYLTDLARRGKVQRTGTRNKRLYTRESVEALAAQRAERGSP